MTSKDSRLGSVYRRIRPMTIELKPEVPIDTRTTAFLVGYSETLSPKITATAVV